MPTDQNAGGIGFVRTLTGAVAAAVAVAMAVGLAAGVGLALTYGVGPAGGKVVSHQYVCGHRPLLERLASGLRLHLTCEPVSLVCLLVPGRHLLCHRRRRPQLQLQQHQLFEVSHEVGPFQAWEHMASSVLAAAKAVRSPEPRQFDRPYVAVHVSF